MKFILCTKNEDESLNQKSSVQENSSKFIKKKIIVQQIENGLTRKRTKKR